MLKQTLHDDLDNSLREKNTVKTSTLRMLLSSIGYFEIDKGKDYDASDQDILDVLQKEVKKRHEAIEMYNKGNRPELAQKETDEMKILQSYLPKQMNEEEITKLVKDAIAKTGATTKQDMGKVMAVLMPLVKGKADGSTVSRIVISLLNTA